MKTFKLRVEQNGGEYYGYVEIKGHTYELEDDNRTIIVDDVEITFDEMIYLVSVK
jgi:hypothetical protein